MNTNNYIAAIALSAFASSAFAGNTWDGGGGNDNFTTGANWTGDSTPGYGTLTFDNTGGGARLNPNNDNGSLSMNGIYFNSGSYSYTVGGNTINFFDNGGTQAKIENAGSASQTISLTVDFEATAGTGWAEINPVNGNLTFGSTVNMNGSQVGEIRIYGDNANKVTFNGVINGGAGKDVRIMQYSIAEFNASMAYQGETEIQEGELWIGAGGDISGSSTIYVGNGGLTGNTAKLFISDLDGGTTFDNTINVNGGSGAVGNRTVGGINTSGINTFSGTISRASDANNITLTLFSGGGTVSFGGDITGNDAVLIDANGNGVIRYTSSAKNYGGDTYILDGEFRVEGNYAPGNVYLGETSGSDAATFSIGTAGVTEDAGIIVRNGSAGTLTVTSAQASGDATFSGTVSLDNNVTLSSSSAGRTIFAGQIQDGLGAGTHGAAVNTAGTVQLSGGVANSGTSWTVQEGTLELNKAAGTNAINGTTIVEAGGTLKNLASNQIADGSAVTVQSDGAWNVNGQNETVASLDVDGTLSLGTGQVIMNAGGGTWSGTVSASSGGFLVFKSGITALVGANTGLASGSALYVVGGTLGLNNNSAAGSSTIFLGETSGSDAATINSSVTDTTIGANIVVRSGSGGNKTIDNASGGTITFGGNVDLQTTAYVDVSTSETTVFNGMISNSGGIIKRGFGTMTISNANTFAGALDIDEGTVRVGSGGDLTSAANIAIGGAAHNSGAGAAGLTLASGAAAIDRDIVVEGGAGSRLLASEGNNTVSGTITQSANLTVSSSSGTLSLDDVMMNTAGNNDLAVGGTGNVNIGGTITAVSGESSVDKSGAGTLTISGDNSGQSYMLNIGGGKVVLDNANALGTSYGDKVNFTANSTLTAAANISPASLGLRVGNGITGTIEVNSGNNLSAATLGSVSGTGTFNKTGTGTLTLTGTSTAANANNVNGGTLFVSSGAALAGTTTVSSGGTLAGSGSVGATTITNGGRISPGNSPGTLALTNGLTWGAGGNYDWQIYNATGTMGSTNGWDLIAVTGAAWDITGLSTNNPFNINLWSLSGVTPDVNGNALNFNNTVTNSWEILTYASLNGTFNSNLFAINTGPVGPTGGFANALGGGVFSLAVDGNSLNLLFTPGGGPGPSPVPEPGTWAAAALLAGAAGYVRWRRRKEADPKA